MSSRWREENYFLYARTWLALDASSLSGATIMGPTWGKKAPCEPHRRACASCNEQHDRGMDHDAALRVLSNWLVGILHVCLKT